MGQASPRDQEGIELAAVAELIEPAQGGDDPLPGATAFPAVLNDLEIGAGPGGLGAEEHGDLPVGRVTIIMGRFPPISRGKLLKTWHHV